MKKQIELFQQISTINLLETINEENKPILDFNELISNISYLNSMLEKKKNSLLQNYRSEKKNFYNNRKNVDTFKYLLLENAFIYSLAQYLDMSNEEKINLANGEYELD